MNLLKKLDNLKVFMTTSTKQAADMKATADSFLKTSKLEELMRVSDNGQNVKIFVKSGATDSQIKELFMFIVITSPAMVSSTVAESIVFIRKLLPFTIWMMRMVSAEAAALMTCCAEILELQKTKIKIKNLLMVNFNRNGPVFIQPVNWGFIL